MSRSGKAKTCLQAESYAPQRADKVIEYLDRPRDGQGDRVKIPRRRLLASLPCVLGGLWAPFAALAQAQQKIWRIGVLHPGSKLAAGARDIYTNFFDGMRELGYVRTAGRR